MLYTVFLYLVQFFRLYKFFFFFFKFPTVLLELAESVEMHSCVKIPSEYLLLHTDIPPFLSLVNCILIAVSQDCSGLVLVQYQHFLEPWYCCVNVSVFRCGRDELGMLGCFVANLSLLGDLTFYLAFSCVFL